MKRKLVSVLLSAAMMVTLLTGCGGNENNTPSNTNTGESTAQNDGT